RPARAAPLGRLLRAELCYLPWRRATLVSLGVLALVPLLLGIGVTAGRPTSFGVSADTPGTGLLMATHGKGMALPVIALVAAQGLLLPLTVSITAAEALAGEAAYGSLRGLLLAPVSRPRLVGVKAGGVFAMATLSVLVVAAVGLVAGVTVVGGGGRLL